MISICTVTLHRLQDFLNIFIESIITNLKHVKEVIILNVEEDQSYYKEVTIGTKVFKYFGGKQEFFPVCDPNSYCSQHALGLHIGIEKASQEYIWLSDPDIFFYGSTDETYLKIMHDYKLKLIGISHPNAINEALGYFPTVTNLLIKKIDLPTKDFIKNELDLSKIMRVYKNIENSIYLFPGKANVDESLYYNKDGHYETGVNLVPWSIQQGWKWASFQTLDCSNYTTLYRRTSHKFTWTTKNERLLYHSGLASGPHNKIVSFQENYKNFKNEL